MIRTFIVAFVALLALASAASAQVNTALLQITPNASAYSAGNCLGGALKVPGTTAPQGDGGTIITDITVVDSSGQDAAIDFLIFEQKPAGTYTDKSACTLAAADQVYALGPFKLTAYTIYGTAGIGRIGNIAQSVNILPPGSTPPAGSGFWVVPVVQGTPTYGAAQTLSIQFGVILDQLGRN